MAVPAKQYEVVARIPIPSLVGLYIHVHVNEYKKVLSRTHARLSTIFEDSLFVQSQNMNIFTVLQLFDRRDLP